MLVKITVGDLLLTFSAFSECVWFSFLSHFLVSMPWLLSFLFPFLIEVVLLRKKKIIVRVLEKLYNWTNIPISFLSFCCSLCWFFKSSLNFSLLPVFLHSLPFYILLLSPLFFLFSQPCFSSLDIFVYLCWAYSTFISPIPFEMLSSYYVDLLFCYLLYLSMPSLVCLVVNVVLVSHLFLFGSVFLFVSISSFLMFSHAVSELSVLFSVFP